MRVYYTVFIVTFNCFIFQSASSSSSSLSSSQESDIISCTSELAADALNLERVKALSLDKALKMEILQLNQDNDGPCCSEIESLYTACGIASTLNIQPNRQHIRVNLTRTTHLSMVHGVRLEIWRDAMDDCPISCLTFNTSKNGGGLANSGNYVMFIECAILETQAKFSVDVLPLFKDNIDVKAVRCQDIEVHLTYPELDAVHGTTLSTSTPSSSFTKDAWNKTVAKQRISLLPSAIALIGVIFCVSMLTATIWYIFLRKRERTLSTSFCERSDDIRESYQDNGRFTQTSEGERPYSSSSNTRISAPQQLDDINDDSFERLQYSGRFMKPSEGNRPQDFTSETTLSATAKLYDINDDSLERLQYSGRSTEPSVRDIPHDSAGSLTSLPESFRVFIKNVNLES